MKPSEEKVLADIKLKLRVWINEAHLLQFTLTFLGVIWITSSVVVAVFAGSDFIEAKYVKMSALIATLCFIIISSFNLKTKTSNYLTAWRRLSYAVYSFETEIIDIKELIKSYEESEKMLGSIDFQFNKTDLLKGENV